jgi:hypothetical protein
MPLLDYAYRFPGSSYENFFEMVDDWHVDRSRIFGTDVVASTGSCTPFECAQLRGVFRQ